VRTVKVGDAVITCLSAFCGHCEFCVTGRMSLCLGAETRRKSGSAEPRLSRPDGSPVNQMLNLSAFAEQMLIHEHACTRIDPEMPLDRAAVIGCAVTTGAGTIFNACKVTPGETVAVVGCGGVGLATINAAKIAGAGRIIAADPIPEKRELAKKLGATDVVDALANDAAEQIIELTKGGVDHAVEAVGRPASGELAVKLAASRWHGDHPWHDAADALGRPVGYGPAVGQETARRDHGRQPLPGRYAAPCRFLHARVARSRQHHIAERIPLEQINEGFEKMKKGDSARSVIVFDQ
jgi:S-(hydroxymethyl)glutathione dehydrogenase/alcohol dehydrogenase